MDNQPMASDVGKDAGEVEEEKAALEKCPGWPGYNVFRLVVAVSKVESIIGCEGELVNKMCKETHASIRVLVAPLFSADRIVLIFGKEEPDMLFSPAMDAAVRVFKRVADLSSDKVDDVAVTTFCSIRLLVASSQATDLIGKQGSTIKSIRDVSHASIRVLSEVPFYATSDERIVEIHGKALNVLKGLEAVLGRLRKFLVDQSVIPIFEQVYNAKISQERPIDAWADKTQPSSLFSFAYQTGSLPLNDGENELEPEIPPSGLSLDAQDDEIGAIRSTGVIGAATPIVPQVTQTMQVPISYAVDIIGDDGSNIAYIRQASQATVIVQESEDLPDEMITVEIQGTFSQVQIAQQLIEDFTSNHEERAASIDDNVDAELPEISSISRFASDIKGDGPPSSDEEGSASSSASNNLGRHS